MCIGGSRILEFARFNTKLAYGSMCSPPGSSWVSFWASLPLKRQKSPGCIRNSQNVEVMSPPRITVLDRGFPAPAPARQEQAAAVRIQR